MNVMNALIPEAVSGQNVQLIAPKNNGRTTNFESYLSANQLPANDGSEMSSKQKDVSKELTDLLTSLLNGEFTADNLSLTEEEAKELQNLLVDLQNAGLVIEPQIVQILEQAINFRLDNGWEEAVNEQVLVGFNQTQIEQELTVQGELLQLFNELSRIFNGNEDSLKEQATALFPLLRQWSQLKEQLGEEKANQLVTEELSEKDATIWKQLMNVYEKRSYFTESNMYRSDSAVTRNDVMNWLQQAFNQYETQTEKVAAPVVTQQQQIPMSEVQQYTIHVNSLDKVERVSDEVINKFTNIIRESRFLTNNNMSQLSITLRPEHLGNMIVKFTQIDGEMAVKIIVASQAAKSMLESNIHQLKHMFSPHQVVIERNESISDDEFFSKEEKHEDEQDSLHEESNSRENKENEAAEIDFNELFQQLSEEEIANE